MRQAVTFVSLTLLSVTASAQALYERAKTWEFAINLVELGDFTATGERDSSIKVHDELGWGLGGAYNFTNHFAVDFGWSHASPSYDATFRLENTNQLTTISYTMDIDNFLVKGTYYVLGGDLTPYISVGGGWSQVDSNVADGPPTTGCWWDPWWGYICSNFYSTYETTKTSYIGSVGIRWDLSPSYSLRADWGMLRINAGDAEPEPDVLRVGFSWRF